MIQFIAFTFHPTCLCQSPPNPYLHRLQLLLFFFAKGPSPITVSKPQNSIKNHPILNLRVFLVNTFQESILTLSPTIEEPLLSSDYRFEVLLAPLFVDDLRIWRSFSSPKPGVHPVSYSTDPILRVSGTVPTHIIILWARACVCVSFFVGF